MRHAILGPDTELVPVDDADEEVFLLYTALAAAPAKASVSTGLGSVNSFKDRLTIDLELPPVKAQGKRKEEPRNLSIDLAQDVTSLRSRKGDTGSVLWRASVFLAQLLLSEYHSSPARALFSRDRFAKSNVLELGAGTGLLALALGPLVARYTATDLDFLVPLMRKNFTLNDTPETVFAEPLDWIALQSLPAAKRPSPAGVSLVLAVDTLYNPALVPSFVAALEHYTSGGACALVVCELRSEDVIRDFLEAWLSSGKWQIYRIGSDLFELPFVAWAAWQSDLVHE